MYRRRHWRIGNQPCSRSLTLTSSFRSSCTADRTQSKDIRPRTASHRGRVSGLRLQFRWRGSSTSSATSGRATPAVSSSTVRCHRHGRRRRTSQSLCQSVTLPFWMLMRLLPVRQRRRQQWRAASMSKNSTNLWYWTSTVALLFQSVTVTRRRKTITQVRHSAGGVCGITWDVVGGVCGIIWDVVVTSCARRSHRRLSEIANSSFAASSSSIKLIDFVSDNDVTALTANKSDPIDMTRSLYLARSGLGRVPWTEAKRPSFHDLTTFDWLRLHELSLLFVNPSTDEIYRFRVRYRMKSIHYKQYNLIDYLIVAVSRFIASLILHFAWSTLLLMCKWLTIADSTQHNATRLDQKEN